MHLDSGRGQADARRFRMLQDGRRHGRIGPVALALSVGLAQQRSAISCRRQGAVKRRQGRRLWAAFANDAVVVAAVAVARPVVLPSLLCVVTSE